ncbi:MAG: hypothetical protein KDK97_09150 [Verrucomicrobiales bacterium]|nr:hypothetical protein [Verrucomicrobiales bacterium]MCP5557726.1 hypothetical protein [Verrucomicrobiaceae bacterium]
MMNTPQRIPAAELPAWEWDDEHESEAYSLLWMPVFTRCMRILNLEQLAEEAVREALISVFKHYNPALGRPSFSPAMRLLIYARLLGKREAKRLLDKEKRHRELGERLRTTYESANDRRRSADVGQMFDEPKGAEIIYLDPVVEDLARRAAAIATFADQAEAVLRLPDPGVLPSYVEEHVQLCLDAWREFHFASGLDVEALARRGLALAASLCKPSKDQDPCPIIFRCFATRWRLAISPKPWKDVAALILAETGVTVSPNCALIRVKRVGEKMKKILLRS